MKHILTAVFSLALLAGCGEGANDLTGEQDPFRKALSASPGASNLVNKPIVQTDQGSSNQASAFRPHTPTVYPRLNEVELENLAELNFAIATEYIQAADRIRKVGRTANGVLIFSAALYGVGASNGVAENTLKNGLIYALGLSEGLRFSGTSTTAKAFLLAADQSTCVASRAIANKDGNKNAIDVAALWEVTYTIQTDLRRSMVRKNVNFFQLATGLVTADRASEAEYLVGLAQQQARAAVRLSIAEKNSFEAKLYGCLVSSIQS